MIDAIAAAGGDAVKFQTHIAAAESTLSEPWRVPFARQDATRYDYWKRMEFTEEHWRGLREHALAKGLAFVSSPFSLEAADLLARVGVDAWKVPSGETGNRRLLEGMLESGEPVLLSTGMSPLDEVDAAVTQISEAGVPFAVLQCTTAYPCPPEKLGLNLLSAFRDRYACPVGLSDHSGTIFAGLAAVTIGIEVLEVHVTLSRDMPGPDVPASVTPTDLRQLVEGIRFIEVARRRPIDKDEIAREMSPLRRIFNQSVVAARDLPKGSLLRAGDLTTKKPGTGIPGSRLPELLGRCLAVDVTADTLLTDEMLARARTEG
jgi:N-acetylneuraminate synthase